jgi:hypothetical protein
MIKILSYAISLIFIITLMSFLGPADFSSYGQTNSSNITTGSLQNNQSIPLIPLTNTDENTNTNTNLTAPNSGFKIPRDNNDQNKQDDLILLNQQYNNEKFGDHLVGELLNNGT